MFYIDGTREVWTLKTTSSLETTATYSEIITQPDAWQESIQVVAGLSNDLVDLWKKGDYANVVFAGCGSTHYLSLAAAALFQELTGHPARGIPGGELAMYPATIFPSKGRTLLVAVSRSAETTETLQAVRAFQHSQRGDVITVTNYGDRPMSRMGAVNIIIPTGQERSVAQTRSFASMYVATTALAATLAGRQDLLQAMQHLPQLGHRLISQYEDLAQASGSDLESDRFYFLGGGPRYGLACEVNLKMKEMSLTHSEPFHFLEFRHGPQSMVTPSTLVIGLLSDTHRILEAAVLEDVKQLGGHTLALGESETDVVFASQLPEPVRNVLYLPVLQLMAYYRSLAKELNPDQPHNLNAVVKLEWTAP
jgi:glucosamine--fructose-6-phosphate aminotransferase (isomerizing)